jgi:hypothetical protein
LEEGLTVGKGRMVKDGERGKLKGGETWELRVGKTVKGLEVGWK